VEFNVLGGSGEGMINSPYVRLTPDANVVTLLRGDFNRDSRVTNADLQAMLDAIKNLNAYKQTYHLSEDDLRAIGDFVGSDGVNAADIKPMLAKLAGNGDPFQNVPEPAGCLLLSLGITFLFCTRRLAL
jgi:hypothetical protein